MKTANELKNELKKIHRKPYPAYKGLKGSYRFQGYTLVIDHVQGDPFAAPSRLHVSLTGREAGFPEHHWENKKKRIALADYCLRQFGKKADQYAFQAKGSGKSGLISVSSCGQQVLERSSCQIGEDGSVLLRFQVGFPANGRTINSMELSKIIFDYLPVCVEKSLLHRNIEKEKVQQVQNLYEDQEYLRDLCREKGWIAFVADGSVLPRQSGISQKPMKNAKAFYSPVSMREEVKLPHRGNLCGMAIRRGITLIVGGGYHGKSTLLNALETGIYNHIAGDGREYVIADRTSFKIRAEDGRSIAGTDISRFINHLPNGRDTEHFWTEDASGSTSQAANVAEAVESGVKVLLIDEDTSATNFMVRDELMARVIAKEKEPITPFLSRARKMYGEQGISTILVAGSSGAYFSIADKIIQMDCYQAYDITEQVREICGLEEKMQEKEEKGIGEKPAAGRHLKIKPLDRKKGQLKVKQYGLDSFSIGRENLEIRGLEQILDYEQTTTLSYLLKATLEEMEKEKCRQSVEFYMDRIYKIYEQKGMEGILETENLPTSFARVRRQDFAACLNRYRGFSSL
jgi:predicted ABC-class ATPase